MGFWLQMKGRKCQKMCVPGCVSQFFTTIPDPEIFLSVRRWRFVYMIQIFPHLTLKQRQAEPPAKKKYFSSCEEKYLSSYEGEKYVLM